MVFHFSKQNGVVGFAMSSAFGVTVILASCGRSSENLSQTKSVGHSYSVEPHTTDANLWVVLCKDGTREVRTTNEVRRDNICPSGPKFVATQRTVLTVESESITFPNGQTSTRVENCILPEGAVLNSWQVTNTPTAGVYRFVGSVDSDIADECSKLVNGTILIEGNDPAAAATPPSRTDDSSGNSGRFPLRTLVLFVNKVSYRDYDTAIYGPKTNPFPCPVETVTPHPLPTNAPTPSDNVDDSVVIRFPCEGDVTPIPLPTRTGTLAPQ